MDRITLSKRIVLLILGIFFLNYLAGIFYWYSTIWYFDMPMHFLGGFWLGLFFFSIFWPTELTRPLIGKMMLAVLVVGIGWEVFELIFVNYIAANPFNLLDTISDICFDLAGGLLGILYCARRITSFNKTTI